LTELPGEIRERRERGLFSRMKLGLFFGKTVFISAVVPITRQNTKDFFFCFGKSPDGMCEEYTFPETANS
jgi:hypothetical protein